MLKDDRFGRLTAVRYVRTGNRYKKYWLFKCDCGNDKIAGATDVKIGDTRSCGCLRREGTNKSHGMSRSVEWNTWQRMIGRCSNTNNPRYKDYGGRGIKVCERWLKFENFFDDMGKKPKGLSLDRIDNNGDYCKENCRWANVIIQNNNRRTNLFLKYKGESKTLADWARDYNISYHKLYDRLFRYNWKIKKALDDKATYTRRNQFSKL